jgi:MFS transporter, SET family, sugar efflux transporter
MRHHFSLVWQHPTLRLLALLAVTFGCFMASIGPYQSLIGIRTLGMSDSAFSLLLFAGLIVSVALSVGIGILTDQRPSRRRMALVASISIIASSGLVFAAPSILTFVIAHALIMPVAGTLFGQIFAVCRLCTQHLHQKDRDGVLAIVRSLVGLPWLVVLPLWAWAFSAGVSLLAVYPAIVIFGGITLALVWFGWPPDDRAPWTEVKSGLHFRAALAEILSPPVFIRVQLVCMLQVCGTLGGILLGLVFDAAGRSASTVSLFFAAFVAIEVLVMLFIGWFLNFASRMALISAGVLLYMVYLGLLPVLAGSAWVWALIVPAGVGGALIYALLMGYLADLMGTRAGAGASLLALGRIGQDGTATAAFWAGTLLSGYGLAALFGVGITLVALILVLLLDRQRLPQAAAG